jgi:hypothetical protein
MFAPARIFADNVEAYLTAGLPAFPVNTQLKKPMVKGWQHSSPRRSRAWARVAKLGSASGLGVLMGAPSGLTEIDVDGDGEAWLALAVERFGDTPIKIRTASGKAKLWYRSNGEGRRIRPFEALPIDVLGGGFTIAPPSWREDLAASYMFFEGGIENVPALPKIASQALETSQIFSSRTVENGKRNRTLWLYCMTQAQHCDDTEALIDVAEAWASTLMDPLTRAEIRKTAQSAWRYEISGRNFVGVRKPQLTEQDRVMDSLIDRPEAFTLLQLFARWHSNKTSFAIAPTSMSAAGTPPWPRRRIEKARDVLLHRGFLKELSPPKRGKKAGRYRLIN